MTKWEQEVYDIYKSHFNSHDVGASRDEHTLILKIVGYKPKNLHLQPFLLTDLNLIEKLTDLWVRKQLDELINETP
jgi:hypothetical protein